ncbi:APC family permease [Candidatus Babeliales bacterium]|nr:APC family permease [Candidatus Babeliales bacterium]
MEKNKISLFAAIIMNINIMIGAGIFIAPALMAKSSDFSSFIGWPIVAFILFPIVFSITQITKFLPGQSSFYNYSEIGINKTAGFLSGWFYYLGYASCAGILVIALQNSLSDHIKVINDHAILFSIILITIFCLLNLLNISTISKIQNSITLFKLFPIFFVILVMVFYFNPHLVIKLSHLKKIPYALPFALFAFWGFESSCNISHLIENEEKNAPRATLLAFFIVAAIYTLFHLGVSYIMTPQNLIEFKAVGFPKFLNIKYEIFLTLINSIISAAIITSYFGTAFGLLIANSANLHSLAKNNLLPFSSLLKKTNKQQRPAFSIWVTGITTFIFIYFITTKEMLAPICNIGIIGAFTLTIISLFLIQKKKKIWLKRIPTILAFISCYILAHYSFVAISKDTITRFVYTLPLIILVIVGFLMFKIQEWKSKDK